MLPAVTFALFIALVTLVVRPLGAYLDRVFAREPTRLDPFCGPIERWLYRLTGVDPSAEMNASEYACAFVALGVAGAVLVYGILRMQAWLPWFYPAYHTDPMSPDLAMNTAVSFSTTATWQPYAGDRTLSYASQMLGLSVQNFLAGAAGLATGIAFIRGFSREHSPTIGNFWVDVTRSLLWVLLPAAVVGAVILVWQGVPMNFSPYTAVSPLDGGRQVIAQGPVAALEFVKNLGTNGGGFFNANGAHPFENPTPLSNAIGMLAIVLVPAALTHTFGRMIRDRRQGWLLYAVMVTIAAAGFLVVQTAEQRHRSPALAAPVANMEGKETRFGIAGSTLTAVVTSNAATGSTNAADDSFTPLGGLVLLANMLLGEVAFGGLGTGLSSMVMAALIAVFLAGLMIGRSPEYIGKKIGPVENKLIVLYAVVAPLAILPLAAVALVTRAGLAGLTTNGGPHGLTTILFAYASSFANNGQAFAGLGANSAFYNVTTAAAMMMGRFGLAIPALALAGVLARQGRAPVTIGILRTDSVTFGLLLLFSLLVVAGLSYLPALALGPVLEHFMLAAR